MIARTRLTKKSHPLMQWWKAIDKVTLFSFIIISLVGLVVLSSASAGMAPRLKVNSMYFVQKQALFMIPGTLIIWGISLLNPKHLKALSLFLFF